MTPETMEREPESRARERARHKQAEEAAGWIRFFYFHLAVYVLVNTGLFIADWVNGGGWSFYEVTVGWGIFLGVHFVLTIPNFHFPFLRFIEGDWDRRKSAQIEERIRQEEERERRRKSRA